MLYLLSIADSRATGPSAWSEWKGALLYEMFLKISPYLEAGHQLAAQHPDAVLQQVEQGVDWLRGQVESILEADEENLDAAFGPDGVDWLSAVTDVGRLPADYLLNFTPEVVAGHIRICRGNYQVLPKKALIFPEEMERHWSLLIVARDRPGLLAKICGVLTLHNLSVLSAQIFTWEGGETVTTAGGRESSTAVVEPERLALAVDVLEVRPLDGLSFIEKDWQAVNDSLDLALAHRLGLEHRIYQKLASIHERRKLPVQQSRIVIDNDISDRYTVIDVHSEDRAGQLYRITQILAEFGINIYRAFIATEAHQLIDVFYVLDREGQKITSESFAAEIKAGLLYAIGPSL